MYWFGWIVVGDLCFLCFLDWLDFTVNYFVKVWCGYLGVVWLGNFGYCWFSNYVWLVVAILFCVVLICLLSGRLWIDCPSVAWFRFKLFGFLICFDLVLLVLFYLDFALIVWVLLIWLLVMFCFCDCWLWLFVFWLVMCLVVCFTWL